MRPPRPEVVGGVAGRPCVAGSHVGGKSSSRSGGTLPPVGSQTSSGPQKHRISGRLHKVRQSVYSFMDYAFVVYILRHVSKAEQERQRKQEEEDGKKLKCTGTLGAICYQGR